MNLNISDSDNSLDYDLALDVAEQFRLKKDEAVNIIEDITSKVRNWKAVAEKYDIPRSEQLIMEKAFRVK